MALAVNRVSFNSDCGISRFWQKEIWAGWREVHILEISVIPDGFVQGGIHGYKTLFWWEIEDHHNSRKKIEKITSPRLEEAWKLRKPSACDSYLPIYHINTLLQATRRVFTKLPEAAVTLGNRRRFGELPTVEWGKLTSM